MCHVRVMFVSCLCCLRVVFLSYSHNNYDTFIIQPRQKRKYDLAVLRTLGFSRWKLFSIILSEGMIISILGSTMGLILGYIVYESMYYFSIVGRSIELGQLNFLNDLFLIWIMINIIAFLTCLIPCMKVYAFVVKSICTAGK